MSGKMMLIINPNAGRGGYKTCIAELLEKFCAADWLPTVYCTRGVGDATRLAAENAGGYDMVVCLGGDGTLSEVSSGLMHMPAQARPPIGYIPLGTANDVARTLSIPKSPAAAAKKLLEGKPFAYDVGLFCSRSYFVYIAAFGAFTEVSYATPADAKHTLGHMAYMLEGIKSLGKIKSYEAIVEWDGGVTRGEFIFGAVMNCTSVGGVVRLDSSNVDLSDGLNEIVLIKRPRDLIEMNNVITQVISGNFSGSNILFLRSAEVRIMFFQPVSWTLDGENGGQHRDVLINTCHPGVEILI
ncbi:MAG: YegS/Rv2252/BmrU family lipid kinase [Oscillospiraceae bacterium]|nr:YegS/Rv2252/BmrU family lipid kinase [Oscillospiraceae bacterium]